MLVTFMQFTDRMPLRFSRPLTLRRDPHFFDPARLALYHGNAPVAIIRRDDQSMFTKLYDADPQLQLKVSGTFLSLDRTEMHGRVGGVRYAASHLRRPQPQS